MIDNVQLKQEEAVGNDVVLNDINPKTNTKSIDDSTTGLPLSYTLDKVWESINNKLSRVVNSVNGRTGVVVLDSSDVGLENVDNVSFADIKDWVVNKMQEEFKNKQIKLFETWEDLTDWITEINDDPDYSGTLFYSEHGPSMGNYIDERAQIGYLHYNTMTSHLDVFHRAINTIGATDNSIIYNEFVDSDRNYQGGKIGVNIWNDPSNMLKLRNPDAADKSDSGLYVDLSIIPSEKNTYFFDCVYGAVGNADSLVYRSRSAGHPEGTKLNIYIDGTQYYPPTAYGSYFTTKRTFNTGDIILTNFNISTNVLGNNDNKYGGIIVCDDICKALVTKQPAYGTVEKISDVYVINFQTIVMQTTDGIRNYGNEGIGLDTLHDIPMTSGGQAIDGVLSQNVSGLNTLPKKVYNESESGSVDTKSGKTVYPTGESTFFTASDKSESRESNGVYIKPNFSLCVIPDHAYSYTENRRNSPISNWPSNTIGNDHNSSQCSLGVNLTKLITKPNLPTDEDPNLSKAINMSGLRVLTSSNFSNTRLDYLTYEKLGYKPITTEIDGETVNLIRVATEPYDWDNFYTGYYYKDGTTYAKIEEYDDFDNFTDGVFKRDTDIEHSGGLMVNVGKFLRIGDPETIIRDEEGYKDFNNYYDDGKVTINVDPMMGLGEIVEDSNALGIRLADGSSSYRTSSNDLTKMRQGGLEFTSKPKDDKNNDGFGYLSVRTGDHTNHAKGLYITEDQNYPVLGVKLYDTINRPREVTPPNLCADNKLNETSPLDIFNNLNENDIIEHIKLRGRAPIDQNVITKDIVEMPFKDVNDLKDYFWNEVVKYGEEGNYYHGGSYPDNERDALKRKITGATSIRWHEVYNINGIRYIWEPSTVVEEEDEDAGKTTSYPNPWLNPFVRTGFGWFKKLFQMYNNINESPMDLSDTGQSYQTLLMNNSKRFIYIISNKFPVGGNHNDYNFSNGPIEIYTWNDRLRLLVPNVYNGGYDKKSNKDIYPLFEEYNILQIYTSLSTTNQCYLYQTSKETTVSKPTEASPQIESDVTEEITVANKAFSYECKKYERCFVRVYATGEIELYEECTEAGGTFNWSRGPIAPKRNCFYISKNPSNENEDYFASIWYYDGEKFIMIERFGKKLETKPDDFDEFPCRYWCRFGYFRNVRGRAGDTWNSGSGWYEENNIVRVFKITSQPSNWEESYWWRQDNRGHWIRGKNGDAFSDYEWYSDNLITIDADGNPMIGVHLAEKPVPWNPTDYYQKIDNAYFVKGLAGDTWEDHEWYKQERISSSTEYERILYAGLIEYSSGDFIDKSHGPKYRALNIEVDEADPFSIYAIPYNFEKYSRVWKFNTPTDFDAKNYYKYELVEGEYKYVQGTTGEAYKDGYWFIHNEKYRPVELMGHYLTTSIMARYDTDRDGLVDATDSTAINRFDTLVKQGEITGTTREQWMAFCKRPNEYGGLGLGDDIYDSDFPEGTGKWTEQYEDPNAITGLKLRYNQYKGMTSNAHIYSKNTQDTTGLDNHLGVKIYDPSVGYAVDDTIENPDPCVSGGLRFTTDGFLAIRINDENKYNATDPSKRGRSYTGRRIPESITSGTKGLRIYHGNVLGIQLDPGGKTDNGFLAINSNGCLTISPNFNPEVAGKTLTITDGTKSVTYDGKTDVTLTIGPGLKLVEE